jgi:undecaprenyl diphosphate synthase
LDNIAKRPSREVKFLLKIFEQNFKKLAKSGEIHKNGIKINVIGRWKEMFPENVKKAIQEAVDKTKNYKNYRLTFLMAYSGIDEMTSAIQRIAKIKNLPRSETEFLLRGQKSPKEFRFQRNPMGQAKIKIDEDLIKANLWTKDLPPVDLVIRTGGEPHWSAGLMMWDVANSQLYFTNTLYPDFSVEEFKKAIEKYSQTERRMGK